MSKDYSGRIAADHEALDDVALVAGLVELLLTSLGLCEASLRAFYGPIGRHVETIDAHDRHAVLPSGMSAACFAQATAHKAFGTPIPEG